MIFLWRRTIVHVVNHSKNAKYGDKTNNNNNKKEARDEVIPSVSTDLASKLSLINCHRISFWDKKLRCVKQLEWLLKRQTLDALFTD